MTDFERCHPGVGLPVTRHVGASLQWFSTDSPEHSIPFSEEFGYEFNECGYRCDSFQDRRDIVVLTVGCSATFGLGVPVRQRYSRLFCDLLSERTARSVSDYNLAWPGASSDYVARIVHYAVPHLRPDVVLVTFPHLPRREYFDAQGEMYDHRPDRLTEGRKQRGLANHLRGLTSNYEDVSNLWKNYRAVRSSVSKLPWCWAVRYCDEPLVDRFRHLFDETNRSASLKKEDVARDGGHVGIKTHARHAENLFAKYVEAHA